MLNRPHSIPDLETADYSESLRRQLYDIAAGIVFDSDTAPDYSPDESDLTVFYIWGRWFASWRDWESESDAETPLPLSRAWQVVRGGRCHVAGVVGRGPDRAFGQTGGRVRHTPEAFTREQGALASPLAATQS